MTLLLPPDALRGRRAIARGALAPLADGLRRELAPLIEGSHAVPAGKALLSRAGGRCERDGSLLVYDPFDARHRCARCGREHRGELHDRFRLYWHHLWLAERAVHGALLGVLLDDAACTTLASDLLDNYATAYLAYPNADNVLGPSRPFFSTYLESIWMLQLAIALDLLESPESSELVRALGARVRERLITPSAILIASYDEGMSNRQVWNNAALIAAARVLGDDRLLARTIDGPSGLHAHLGTALLADGSWYEGENYHLFAHRGLWYGVLLAEQAGRALPDALSARFREGFAAPFRTILPDLTYPSRRDSQYAVSVRQPRVAESCELGLARGDDARLLGMLARLYDPTVPRRATGRAATSADVERNVAATGLTRADLSWRTLLLARETLPPLAPVPLRSDLLPAQGFAILRRHNGSLYAALDYGHSGGGHGHPDRLTLLLSDGATRWFDDPGTGSYVEPSLHWYRSTLAHTAPLVDGRSQPRVHGTLVAFDDSERAGWVCAEAPLAPTLRVRRTLVLLDDYLVDELEWTSDVEHEVALPLHGIELVDAHDRPLPWVADELRAGAEPEDGFGFLEHTARVPVDPGAVRALGTRPAADGALAQLHGAIATEADTVWWRAEAPRAPGQEGLAPMLLARCRARHGRLVGVWSWRNAIAGIKLANDALAVTRRDGRVDEHARTASGWRLVLDAGGAEESMLLGGLVNATIVPATLEPEGAPSDAAILPASFSLGEVHYRGAESGWREAGEPRARVDLSIADDRRLVVTVTVEPSGRLFAAEDAVNPLDNEPAAINGDGVQLYLRVGETSGGWLLVPRAGSDSVGVLPITGWGASLAPSARWSATPGGYRLDARVALPARSDALALDVLVNEIVPGRARRRGQLVLSGARGEFVYLRGDRHEPSRLLRFILPDV